LESAWQEVRRQQKTQEWHQRYAARAEVEGTQAGVTHEAMEVLK
jgi:hypothetical protein